jgi:PAS domain S-box-containing protein
VEREQSGVADARIRDATGDAAIADGELLGAPVADGSAAVTSSLPRTTTVSGIDPSSLGGASHFVGIGATIMLLFEGFYLLSDRYRLAGFHNDILPLHLFLLCSLALYWLTAGSRLGTLHRQSLVVGTCLALFAATGALAVATANDEFLVLTLMIVLVGSSALVAWGGWWQALLSLSSVAAMAAWMIFEPYRDAQAVTHWAAIFAAAAFAQLAALVGARYRRELNARMAELDANHRRLMGEIAQREAAVTASETINRRLRESEAKLRKIFATTADIITINRLNDGRYMDFNQSFERLGYARAEVLAQSPESLGIWAKPGQLRDFMGQIKKTGAVANFDHETRAKDGTVYQYQASATIVELGGQECVVAISRDNTTIKQTERDLIAAREAMRAQIETLEQTQERLRAEIIERTRAMEQREAALQRLADSESKLRKIFETSTDGISISRLSDGRFLDLNPAFSATGYTRQEMLDATGPGLGLWADRAQLRTFQHLMRTQGTVSNLEVDLKTKSGAVFPYLVSATVIDLEGEPCVVSIGRDITAIKHTQIDLIAAREEMREQIATLEETEERLRAEIVERTRALDQRAVAEAARTVAVARLGESEAKLRRIFATTTDSITISRLADGRYLDLNEGFCTASGYARAEALQHTAGSLGVWDDRAKLQEFLREIRKTGTVANFELRMRTKGGSVSLFLVSATIMELGGEACVVAIGKDITTLKQVERDLIAARELMRAQIETLERTEERLRAEIVERSRAMKQREEAVRELADSEGKLRRIFEVTPDSMSIARISDGRIIAVNESVCAMSGLKREELVGRINDETGIWSEDGLKKFGQALRVNGSVKDFEAMLRHKSGRVIPHIVSGVVAELGGELCVISVAHDVTDQKRVETELMAARGAALAASLAKSEFLSAMSHEIRTPMNAILGMADMLWESELDTEQRRYLATMRSNSNTLLDLINEILDLAKVESGRLHLEQIPIDLRDLIEKLLETLAVRAQSKGLELIGRIVPGTVTALRGDPLRLRQILFNLVGNAIKFTHAGEIELTLERSGPPTGYTVTDAATCNGIARARVSDDAAAWMRITVRDTGIGISAMQARSIFSSFTQADSSMARKYGGSGLGLTIVKRLVDLMGGAIAIESTPGAGSSFTVTVPLETRAAGDEPIYTEAPDYGATALTGIRVLIADENASSRAMLREVLAAAGATVEEALDGPNALLKRAKNNFSMVPYNVLLLDERLARLNGFKPVRRIAEDAGCRAAGANVVVLTTALPGTEPARNGKGGGDAGRECRYVVKPIKRADLLGAVMEATGRKPQEHASAEAGAAASNGANGREPQAITESANLRPLRILLADDSPDNRMLIDAYMKRTPYTVEHAADGLIAVEKVRANHYDLVLMDIQMPVMDGYTAVRAIREWERAQGLARMPIIALTASALDESVLRSLEAGCDAHVSKPVRKATLLQVIIDVTEASSPAASNGHVPALIDGMNPTKRQRIKVDGDLRDLVPGFLAHKRADVGNIQQAISEADYKTLGHIGHKMKGEGGSYGFDAVTALGAVLERAALDQDLATARHTLDEFAAYLDSVEVIYT